MELALPDMRPMNDDISPELSALINLRQRRHDGHDDSDGYPELPAVVGEGEGVVAGGGGGYTGVVEYARFFPLTLQED